MERGAVGSPKTQATDDKRTITFGDEAGFSVLPLAVSPSAPAGQTPVLTVPVTRDPLSARGAITPEGTLVMHTQDHSSNGPDGVCLLPVLTREIPGNVLVIWDGASMHRSQAVTAF